ncbi:MAG: glycosyltransferase [Acidobacteria bacterium]|nr:glycosyltransferase [Acidobacteriota bacterium]
MLAIFLLIAAPPLLAVTALALLAADLFSLLRRRAALEPDVLPSTRAASLVIPNWNGRELLARYLPSVIEALAGNPDNEILVVDNASTDGSAAYLKEHFPQVRVLELEQNLGFGGGSNAGVRAARNDIVVLLNSDMRVEPGFLQPLLEGFYHPRVFAVSAQIFFTDSARRREETGLTQVSWRRGRLQVGHRIDPRVRTLFPVFYAGGGSSAYDRKKFLALGGFDPLYEPFYLEDTDLSYLAWKRGWTVHYEPRSVVYHEHRGTIGRRFEEGYILRVLRKNHLLFAWKNIHDWRLVASHFAHLYAGLWLRLLAGDSPERPTPRALLLACRELRRTIRARLRARHLATISDREAFRRPLGGYFADRFAPPASDREKLHVLFLSPYPIRPPIHGGAVFMDQTLRELAARAHVHLLCLLDQEQDLDPNRALEQVCDSVEFLVRAPHDRAGWSALLPHAVRVFSNRDLAWRIHRTLFTGKIDVDQIDYTQLAVYAMDFRRIATFLFEHDIYFQSIARSLASERSPVRLVKSVFEYLRALRFELQAIRRFDAVQLCTRENKEFLESFVGTRPPLAEGLRAGIDVDRYRYVAGGREPDTLLFVGNFQHLPNIVGAQAGPGFAGRYNREGAEFLGQVEDIRGPLERYALMVCPVLSGSGVRVKLLEAFASGLPVVSTPLGAEGLARASGDLIELAETPEEFARKILELLADPARARQMAERARREVEQNWDVRAATARLEASYREVLAAKLARASTPSPPRPSGPFGAA